MTITEQLDQISASLAGSDPPIPDTVDELFSVIAEQFRTLTAETRDEIRRSLGSQHSPALWRMSERCIQRSLDSRDASYLRDALTAHAIEDFRADPRENQLRLVLLLWATRHLGDDGGSWTSLQHVFSESGARHLREFLGLPKYAKELRSVGLRAVESGGTITFEPMPTGWQSGRR